MRVALLAQLKPTKSNMAFIYIRGRREPIEIENDRARKIKALRFGDINGENKADPSEMVDLGDDWAGELGKITAVEITKKPVERAKSDPEAEHKIEEARMLALPIETRLEQLGYGYFKLSWWMRSGQREKEPPEAVMAEAAKASKDWYKLHPSTAFPPNSAYEPILSKYWGAKKGDGSMSGELAASKKLSTD